MEEIDFTLMSNIAEEVEREHEGLLPFTEMVNIMLARYHAAQHGVHADVGVCTCENVTDAHRGTWLICAACLKPRRR